MRSVAELFFPPICASCGELLPFNGFFGNDSAEKSQLCPLCLPLWKGEKEHLCGTCGKMVSACLCATGMMESAGCKTFCKLVYYHPGNREEVGNRVIYRIKDHADRAAVNFLARELAPSVRACMGREEWREKEFFVTFLPRRQNAVLGSGNDQAKELAVALAGVLELPLLPLIGRHGNSRKPQKFLPPTVRLSNATEAFFLREKQKAGAKGKICILVDDIVTSGASMTAGIRLARRAGAKDFLAVAVASDECNENPVVVTSEKKSELDRYAARFAK